MRVVDRNTPSDPRLRERRGDLVGLNALLFAVAVVAAFGLVAWILLGFLPGSSGGPTGSPSAAASPSATASRTPSPSPGGSPTPSAAPSSPATPSPATGTVGTPADLVVDDETVGTVTVDGIGFQRRVGSDRAPNGMRFAVVAVTYTASASLEVDPAAWQVETGGGERVDSSDAQPTGALEAGTLDADEEASGGIAFLVPQQGQLQAVVLRSEDGSDAIVFEVPE